MEHEDYLLRSIGHFTDEQWDEYTNENDISVLDVDGIIPSTGFEVIERSVDEKEDEGTPGFGILFIILALMMCSLFYGIRFRRK